MKKVIVIGCPGAGKSTFSRKLREETGLPLCYLDMIWHRPDGTNVTREEFDGKLREILKGDRWIVDGNYLRTLEVRLAACDTVFLLDYPLEVCLEGAASRIGKKREDLPWVEEEFDPEFRRWILDFRRDQLPEIYEMLRRYGEEKEITVFRSREEGDEYLRRLREQKGERE
ncbi:MAG TPA: adenylate kinase [Candidatus Lachnoclostridium stercorigallinarum]|uniref:Adenylate kinase n=1 Tax=Candidatus Lachnoclostridium stercorigallinarum TaxID=2838634 RepID=A0A9D2GK95_9FIRM|nr:adenylate kinase [Candidatus Lachnoclostridium stercorigallinarum]